MKLAIYFTTLEWKCVDWLRAVVLEVYRQTYCAHGNYQSMLDEYCHLLATSGSDVHAATSKLEHAMGIRSSSEQVHFWENRTKAKDKCSSSMRCHFAVPLGNQKLNDDSGLKRVVSVRDAFNSPIPTICVEFYIDRSRRARFSLVLPSSPYPTTLSILSNEKVG
ncbi:hypothetical protein ACVSD9_24380 [Vibrio parahaemolyticus]